MVRDGGRFAYSFYFISLHLPASLSLTGLRLHVLSSSSHGIHVSSSHFTSLTGFLFTYRLPFHLLYSRCFASWQLQRHVSSYSSPGMHVSSSRWHQPVDLLAGSYGGITAALENMLKARREREPFFLNFYSILLSIFTICFSEREPERERRGDKEEEEGEGFRV